MKLFRPRMSETEYDYFINKRITDKKSLTVLFSTDQHGWFTDLIVQRCINRVIQRNKFDQIVLPGDVADWPYISRHEKRLYGESILNGYSEVEEARYVREQILAPLRHSTDAKINFIPGNHDERITKPYQLTTGQLARLAILFKERESTDLRGILDFEKYGIEWNGIDNHLSWYDNLFTVVHGLSIAKNAPERNIQQYWGSGASGHSHRLQAKFVTVRDKQHVWIELGCGRLKDAVEYMPTAVVPDWQHGFGVVKFILTGGKVRFYAQAVPIINGTCVYDGVFYDGNPPL